MAQPLDIDRVYREHGHVVLRRALRLLGDEVEAGEALQEIFVGLIDRPGQFEGRASITTFLYRVTTNHCLNRVRDRRRRAVLLERQGGAPLTVGAPPAEEALAATQLLARLPERLAKVAVYYYIDEMTQDEIAELLGCSRRMVGKLLIKLKRVAHMEVA